MQNYGMYGENYSPSSGSPLFGEELKTNAKRERHEIRLLGTVVGAIIMLSILLENLFVLLIVASKAYGIYQSNSLFQTGVDLIIALLSLLLPFALGSRFLRSISGTRENLLLDSPVDKSQFILAIPAGLGFCMIANRVTSIFVMIISAFGFELSSPDIPMPGGVLGMAASFFRVVVAAAIIEEFCFRGYVMQNLRKFGDWFAIIMSALVFGMMHGNLIQTPFALIAGIALGYLSVKTNTLWTGIIIHGLNNLISLVISYLMDYLDETVTGLIYSFLMSVLSITGLICFFIFVSRQRKTEFGMEPLPTHNSFPAKTGAFFSNPTMIAAIALFAYFTSTFVKRAG